MSVRPGFDGMVRFGTWLPVEITVANQGPDLAGELQLRVEVSADGSSYGTPNVDHAVAVTLPRFSQKRFVLEMYVPTVTSRISARLIVAGESIVEQEVAPSAVPSGELFCGVLARNPTALDSLPGIPLYARQRNVRLAHLDIADLPARAQALGALDCLVLDGLSTNSLAAGQAKALHSWVASGGQLIVAGGQDWQRTVANLPPELLPVTISGTVGVSQLNSLVAFAGAPFRQPGPWLASTSEVTWGNVVLAEGDVPLLVAGRLGAGSVFYLALDPAAEPLRSWAGSEALWRYLFSNATSAAPSPSAGARSSSSWGRVPRIALGDLSGARSPDARGIFLVALVYFVLLVPVSYAGLRLAGRPQWSVWTSGALVVAATAATFSVALAERQPELAANRIGVVRSWDATAPAAARSYVALLANQQVRPEIALPRDALARSIYYPFANAYARPGSWALRVVEEQSPMLDLGSLPPGNLASFVADGQVAAPPMATDLTVSGRHLAGTVVNHGERELRNVALLAGHQVARLGHLAPGQTQSVGLDLSDAVPVGYVDLGDAIDQLLPPDADGGNLREILDAVLNSGYLSASRLDVSATTIFAWVSESPLKTDSRRAKMSATDLTLLVASAPVRFAPGEIRIPPQLVERRPMSATIFNKARRSGMIIAAGDTVATEYTLPLQSSHFDVDYLSVDLAATINGRSDAIAQSALGSFFVFDWQLGDWSEQQLGFGQNVVPDARRFVSPLGVIRVRYTYRPPADANMDQIDISKFDITVGGIVK